MIRISLRNTFATPDLLNDAMKEEEDALKHGIDDLWKHLKERDAKAYASREMTSSWQMSRG